MLDKLHELSSRYKELELLLGDPGAFKDVRRYKELSQEHAQLKDLMEEYSRYTKIAKELEDSKKMFEETGDPEMREMIREEAERLSEEEKTSNARLKSLLIPKDPLDQKNIIMEIRAGTGGEEAALFASDLYRMYTRYAEGKRWKIEILSANETEIGGLKEIVFSISGKNVYENLRFESGGHRVQRVPETEAGGRIHTSAVTVAVLPEAEETDIEVNQEDLRIDVFRSSGPGGQSVNTTDSAVRITHIPSGLVVICQDEKSQHKNKAKALRVLRSRLFEMEEDKKEKERSETRRNQIGSGDRSERIRTYNFPQNRLTDHRINLTLYKLEIILEGNLDEIIEPLKIENRELYLKTKS